MCMCKFQRQIIDLTNINLSLFFSAELRNTSDEVDREDKRGLGGFNSTFFQRQRKLSRLASIEATVV